jgi:hypothetical protein
MGKGNREYRRCKEVVREMRKAFFHPHDEKLESRVH